MSDVVPITLFIVVLSIAVYGIVIYNRFIERINLTKEALSGIDIQLKRRHSLIPKLVECVKAYANFETSALTAITESRTAIDHQNFSEVAEHESRLTAEIRSMQLLVEDYPDLKANKSFLELQQTLTEVEDNIQYARRYYNGCVRNLNIYIDSFPSLLIARAFHFEPKPFFEIELSHEKNPPEMTL